MPRIRVQGTDIEYRVLKTRRNRHIRLTVSGKNGVRISGPRGVPERDLHAMVREKGTWILERLRHFNEMEQRQPRWRYAGGERVLVLGEWKSLRIIPRELNTGSIMLQDSDLLISLPPSLCQNETVIADLFHRWLRNWAHIELPRRVVLQAARMEVTPGRISVRAQRSKWGSCSAAGNISLNMRLLHAPPAVLDYVIIHELAHLRELNHSARFWKIVEQYCPDHHVHEKWLRDHTWLLET
ncbi:MAG: M48 family metallopeptidase [Bacteroidetes bacterium]|nr:M48 family metallopeptidase [Bacteroidota bacterium]